MAAPWFDDLTLQLDEDFDDLEDIQSDKFWNVQLKPANSDEDLGDLKCKILIVALGNSPYLFANRFLGPKFGDWKTVAHIRLSKDTPQMASWETSAVKRTEATLWRASDDVIIVGCRHEVLPEAANRWCEAILDTVKADKVLVWSTFPGVRLQGVECLMDSLPMLRSLATASWPQKLSWPTLEAPNMLYGCPAALLTLCQLHQIPAAVVTLVVGQADVDVEELLLWYGVLQSDCCSQYFQRLLGSSSQELVAQLRKIVPPPSSSGSMFQ